MNWNIIEIDPFTDSQGILRPMGLFDAYEQTITLNQGDVLCFTIVFGNASTDGDPPFSCYVTSTNPSNTGIRAYISQSTGWNSTTGEPYEYSSIGNISFAPLLRNITSDDVREIIYKVWIRMEKNLDQQSQCQIALHLQYDIPEDTIWGLEESRSMDIYIPSGGARRIAISFKNPGTALFYTSDYSDSVSMDTYGYLSTSALWNIQERCPDSYLVEDDDSGIGRNFKIVYTNIKAKGTIYYLYIRTVDKSASSGTTTLHIIPPGVVQVEKWSWDTSNIRQKARDAANSKGLVSNFSHSVWNDLCQKVQDILDYSHLSWDSETFGLTLLETKMSDTDSNDRVLTAQRFNSLRYNIDKNTNSLPDIHAVTGIGKVERGDIVYGQYFITIADTINKWIDLI